jgi:hypothetical protein
MQEFDPTFCHGFFLALTIVCMDFWYVSAISVWKMAMDFMGKFWWKSYFLFCNTITWTTWPLCKLPADLVLLFNMRPLWSCSYVSTLFANKDVCKTCIGDLYVWFSGQVCLFTSPPGSGSR